ncbi:MAG: DNA polymerase IV, partial [Erysipelotrichaceae bacterium]
MWNKAILHSDINHCYAQIEEMKYPELRSVPMAVGGHEESRHGIILTKNDMAKQYNLKTGESLRNAYEKCPNLVVIPPNYDDYMYYTEKVKDIYRDYSDYVESFGLDEAWIDISASQALFG